MKTQNIINAILAALPSTGSLGYFETVYFSEAFRPCPLLSGRVQDLVQQNAALMIYEEDLGLVEAKAREIIKAAKQL